MTRKRLFRTIWKDTFHFEKPFYFTLKILGFAMAFGYYRGFLKPYHGGFMLKLYIAGDNLTLWPRLIFGEQRTIKFFKKIGWIE